MEPLLITIPGLLGGILIALAIASNRHRFGPRVSRQQNDPLSSDAINMSSIRVAGVGGLGLVAMAITVALNVPRIGWTMELGLLLGIAMAVALIVVRRRDGALPSSGQHGGANTVLAIDNRERTPESASDEPRARTEGISHVPLAAPRSA